MTKFGGGDPGELRRMILDILRLWGPCRADFLADLIWPTREVDHHTVRERLRHMERDGLVERRTFDRQTLWQVVGWDAPPQAEPLLFLPSRPKVPSSEGDDQWNSESLRWRRG